MYQECQLYLGYSSSITMSFPKVLPSRFGFPDCPLFIFSTFSLECSITSPLDVVLLFLLSDCLILAHIFTFPLSSLPLPSCPIPDDRILSDFYLSHATSQVSHPRCHPYFPILHFVHEGITVMITPVSLCVRYSLCNSLPYLSLLSHNHHRYSTRTVPQFCLTIIL